MRLLLLGDGRGTIPPDGRGAIQTIIWEYATRLRARGHEVEIANVRASQLPLRLPGLLRGQRFDWIWTHHDPSVRWVRPYAQGRLVHLSHRPVTDPANLSRRDLDLLRRAAHAPYQFCLTREIMLGNRLVNPSCRQAMLPNGVDVQSFRLAKSGAGAICLGAVSTRKRQAILLREGVECDFVGPLDGENSETLKVKNSATYLGAWTRDQLHESLTSYAALVLWSRAEAQPLVVGEAFAAGLSVVLSPEAARNVDTSLRFVTVVEDPADLKRAVEAAVVDNPRYRTAIRAHAQEDWDWTARVEIVERQLGEWGRPARR